MSNLNWVLTVGVKIGCTIYHLGVYIATWDVGNNIVWRVSNIVIVVIADLIYCYLAYAIDYEKKNNFCNAFALA
jgi:membrane protein YdbS with pleckstrin-like domain